ncbi:unnamed protein product [Linum tenue]|uniref:rhamnogalacturonan endolyase n=1 Tax=Linum tenue TaxID=586396 RepID=A0AAV0J601_9ROSI|nr:unnamed protein product [Linum tenue]
MPLFHSVPVRIPVSRLRGTKFSIVGKDKNQIEISFSRKWHHSAWNSTVPLNVDKRYILRRGSAGFYTYTILERPEGWPDFEMDQVRIVLKPDSEMFHFMAISDKIQRVMPTAEDRKLGRQLAYSEAVLLTHPGNPALKGEVDDKYEYSIENRDDKVHGWMSKKLGVGIWVISPSDEYVAGGPLKQDLTSHVGPILLSMFTSTHYTGKDLNTRYRDGKPWRKVYGPVFVYLNSVSGRPRRSYRKLWRDAKSHMKKEVRKWPYGFLQSEHFPCADQRGSVAGQLLVGDKYVNQTLMTANNAYVGLAAPGKAGSWQTDAKGYQFWTRANEEGYFLIKNVRPGNYNLYAFVPGIIGDYKFEANITIKPGSETDLGAIVYHPPRNGPTLWEIGVPDRTASEFFIPDPKPFLTNKLYTHILSDKFRQYGLWDRYTELYPHHDLVYRIGNSKCHQDWFFAHVPRKTGNKTYTAATWQIVFKLRKPSFAGNYTLHLALASAHASELQVRFNDKSVKKPHFSTGLIGKDNAVARHGIHGLYRLYSIPVPRRLLRRGSNRIYLTQSRSNDAFRGIMYDYVRFEGPRELLVDREG